MKRILICKLLLFINLLVFGQIDSTILSTKKFNEEEYWNNLRISLYSDPNYNVTSDIQYSFTNGLKKIQSKDYNNAITDFRTIQSILNNSKVLQKDTSLENIPSPFLYIGICKAFLNEKDSAILYYKKCIESNKSAIEAYNEIGALFINQYKADSALKYFEKGYSLDKRNIICNYNIGYTFFIKHEFDKAKRYLNEVIKINPKINLPYIILGHINFIEDESIRTNKYYSLAIDADPLSPTGYYYRGLYNLKINKLGLAYKDFSKLYELDTLNYYALAILGTLDIKLNRIDIGTLRLAKYASVKIDRSLQTYLEDYRDIELKSLLIELSKGKLQLEEKKVGYELIKNMLNNDWSNNKDITKYYLEKHYDSKFVLRLYLLSLTKTSFDFNINFCDKYLQKDSTLLILQFVKSKLLFDAKKYSLSAESFSKLISLTQKYTNAFYYRGLAYYNSGKEDLAIQDFNHVISEYPSFAYAYNSRGCSLMEFNKDKEAIQDFLKAISIYPDISFYNNLSISYRKLTKVDSAIYYATKAITLNPNFSTPYYNRAIAYKENKEFEKAIHDINKALKLNPNWLIALSLRSELFMKTENYVNAIPDLSYCINFNPVEVEKYYKERAQAYFYTDDFDNAISDFQKLIEKDSTDLDLITSLGDCYQGKKDFKKAINLYDKAIKYKPNSIAYYRKGLCNCQIDSIKQAKTDFENALLIDSTYSSAYGSLARIYYQFGDFNKCIYYSQKAINFDKNALYAMFNIALSNLRLEKFTIAKRYYQLFAKLSGKQCNAYENAINDLKDLINKEILVSESKEILRDVFNIQV